MIGISRGLVCGAVALATVSTAGHAQRLVPVHRHKAGVYFTVLRPTGQFQQFVQWGGGLGAYFTPGFSWEGGVGLRMDGSVMWYGHESYDVWLGPRIPDGYIRVSTNNLIATFGAGPQLTFGAGPVRPYTFGTAGFSYFATVTSTDEDDWDYDSNTNFDDWSLALAAGGGLLIQLNRGHKPIWLDLSAQWTHNGVTEYLREGSIVETADGGLIMFPIRSEANHWTYRLGVAFGF